MACQARTQGHVNLKLFHIALMVHSLRSEGQRSEW